MSDVKKVLDLIKEQDVKYVDLRFTDPRGKWQVTLHTHGSPVTASVEIKGHLDRLTGDLEGDSLQRVSLVLKRLGLLFSGDKMGFNGVVRMSGSIEGEHIQGRGVLPDGQRFTWAGTRSERPPTPSKPIPTASDERALPQISPPVAFGRPELPQKPANVLVRNTTVWTMDDQGKMEKTDIHVSDGKIARIGRNLEAPRGAVEIDGRGKHVTPGMIDAHLHVAMAGGGNESGQAVSAEVAVAATAETPEMIEAVGKKTEGMMVKIAMADAVDGNITKLKNKNRVS